MTILDLDPRFPGTHYSGIPPSPTRENPGGVYPKSDPSRANQTPTPSHHQSIEEYIGNPYLMGDALKKVDHSLGEVIALLENEDSAQGVPEGENKLLVKFRAWRDELESLRVGTARLQRSGARMDPAYEGGMFAD